MKKAGLIAMLATLMVVMTACGSTQAYDSSVGAPPSPSTTTTITTTAPTTTTTLTTTKPTTTEKITTTKKPTTTTKAPTTTTRKTLGYTDIYNHLVAQAKKGVFQEDAGNGGEYRYCLDKVESAETGTNLTTLDYNGAGTLMITYAWIYKGIAEETRVIIPKELSKEMDVSYAFETSVEKIIASGYADARMFSSVNNNVVCDWAHIQRGGGIVRATDADKEEIAEEMFDDMKFAIKDLDQFLQSSLGVDVSAIGYLDF